MLRSKAADPDLNPYKCIFIDWYKTLSTSLFWSQLTDLSHPHADYCDPIATFIFKENIKLINPWMRGEYTSEEICQKIATGTGIDHEIIFDELAESCRKMELFSPDILEIIQAIRKQGVKVVIATDNMDTFRKFTIPVLKLENLFDGFLISNELRALKKDIINEKLIFFDDFMKKNNYNYNEVLLLDDNVDETGVYSKLGFNIIEIKHPTALPGILKKLL